MRGVRVRAGSATSTTSRSERSTRSCAVFRASRCSTSTRTTDGTEEILAGRENLHFWSLFQWPLYPDRKMTPAPENVTQSPLEAGADGSDLKTLLEEVWIPQLRDFRPDFIFLSAGFDAHNEEHMAQLKFAEMDFAYLTRRLTEEAEDLCGGRLVSVLEGGYSIRSLARSVLAHLQTLVRTALERNSG